MEKKKISCYVIMPFSSTINHKEEYWTRHYEYFIKDTVEKMDIDVHRSEPLRESISGKIIMDLITSNIVIADITDYNANVFWELGVRQSFRHGTIIIAEKNTKVPFDISHKGVLFYDSDHLNNLNFIEKLNETIKDCIQNPEKVDSPILQEISGRSTLYSIIKKEENLRKLDALILEINYNVHILSIIIEKINAQKTPGDEIPMMNLNKSSLELLLVSRYIDKEVMDYNHLQELYSAIEFVNTCIEKVNDLYYSKNLNKSSLIKQSISTFTSYKEHFIKVRDYISKIKEQIELKE
jgi:hypothetical protein